MRSYASRCARPSSSEPGEDAAEDLYPAAVLVALVAAEGVPHRLRLLSEGVQVGELAVVQRAHGVGAGTAATCP
jgi:hypothetical protein